MSPNEVKTFFETLVDDDNITDANALVIMNVAKDKLFARRQWEFLKTTDDSNTASGKTYTLPTSFSEMIELWIDDVRVEGIRPSQRRLFRDAYSRYYIDIPNNNLVLTYIPTGGTIYMDYIRETDALTLVDTDIATTIVGFKKSFHALLAYEMAQVYFMQDVGDRRDSWRPEHKGEYNDLLNLMIKHDESLKSTGQSTAIPAVGQPTNHPNVLDN